MFNPNQQGQLRDTFPLLSKPTPTGNPLIYLDNAATALKPQTVIDAVTDVLVNKTANIHRSVHFLGDLATKSYESARDTVSAFINCQPNEVIFLKNSTEGINLVANAFANKGRVISSFGEHHSNFLTWNNTTTTRLPLNDHGEICLSELEKELAKGDVGLVSLVHVSNITGATIDTKKVTELAHHFGAKVLIDAAQSAPHTPIDVSEINCDFLVFSGHKLGAPTGVGVLFGKAELLEEMDFWLRGGATVESVDFGVGKPKNAPWKFEAGTPAIESVAGLDAAIMFLLEIDMDEIHAHQIQLARKAREFLKTHIPQATLLGSDELLNGPLSFYIPGMSPHILARGISDRHSMCVRSGFHCAQPLHQALNAPASLRISHWLYNTEDELQKTILAISDLTEIVS